MRSSALWLGIQGNLNGLTASWFSRRPERVWQAEIAARVPHAGLIIANTATSGYIQDFCVAVTLGKSRRGVTRQGKFHPAKYARWLGTILHSQLISDVSCSFRACQQCELLAPGLPKPVQGT